MCCLAQISYQYTAASNASSTATGGGTVSAVYQINTGNAFATLLSGWGASSWGSGAWNVGESSTAPVRFWSQSNFGEDLIFAPNSRSYILLGCY